MLLPFLCSICIVSEVAKLIDFIMRYVIIKLISSGFDKSMLFPAQEERLYTDPCSGCGLCRIQAPLTLLFRAALVCGTLRRSGGSVA